MSTTPTVPLPTSPRPAGRMQKLLQSASRNKVRTAIITLVVICAGYYGYGKLFPKVTPTQYVLTAVQRGTLVKSVAGSGQVSVSSQIDLKPKASGTVVYVGVKEGQYVKSGSLLVSLDSRDASKAVRDAQSNLDSAKVSLEKLQQPADPLAKIQAENALAQAQQNKQQSQDDLTKAYDDGFNSVANSFLDIPAVNSGLYDILYGTTVTNGQGNGYAYFDLLRGSNEKAGTLLSEAVAAYQNAKLQYDKNFDDYKASSRYADRATIESLISETYETTRAFSESIKKTKNLLDAVSALYQNTSRQAQPPATLATHLASIPGYTATTNSHLGDLLNIKNTIETDKSAIVSNDRTINEKTEALVKLNAGTDPLDIQSQQLAVRQRQNALVDAQQTYANYFVRAPFDGIVAKLSVNKGDEASSGTAVATFITTQQIATVTLNEVDVAKVAVGQKVNLTFDAVPDLTITGKVAQIDIIGTVTQGVVNYSVEISFDTQDDRVKPGMSVSAAIITLVKQDVLLVPNGAVKSAGQQHYVETLPEYASGAKAPAGQVTSSGPHQTVVEVGDADDTTTEIISGVAEGDLVVSRTVASTAATAPAASSAASGLRIPGLTGGGGNFRATGR